MTKEQFNFTCDNSKCKAELSVSLTKEQFQNRLYFKKYLSCQICGIGKMYPIKKNSCQTCKEEHATFCKECPKVNTNV